MSVTSPSPQPTIATDQLIHTIFSVASMALQALALVPGVPGTVLTIVNVALSELQTLYSAYRANPTADVLTQVQTVVDTALGDVKTVLHP